MAARIPKIHPIRDLARYAKALVEYARKHQEPIVITQRGRDAAVLVPIELYRRMEARLTYRVVSPRLVHPEDASRFVMEMTVSQPAQDEPDASV